MDINTYSGDQIVFGEGGGFTGIEKRYALLDNGQLYSIGMDENQTLVKRLKRNDYKQIFLNYSVLNIQDMEIDNPGNKYYFLDYKNKNTDHHLVWSSRQDVSNELNIFFNILKRLI